MHRMYRIQMGWKYQLKWSLRWMLYRSNDEWTNSEDLENQVVKLWQIIVLPPHHCYLVWYLSIDFCPAVPWKTFASPPRGGGGTSIWTYTGRAVFQGIIFQHKFLNRVWKLIRNSETGYDYLFNDNRLLFSRTIDCCFSYCNLIIPKQGIDMQIFS